MSTIELKVAWAEIAGKAYARDDHSGYEEAMKEYAVHDTRHWASVYARAIESQRLALQTTAQRAESSRWAESAYRDMVRAAAQRWV